MPAREEFKTPGVKAISAASRLCGCALRLLPAPQTLAGVDVGEDFLDIALLQMRSARLRHYRIGLADLDRNPVQTLAARLREQFPKADSRWLALIDSPRWPVDLDCSSEAVLRRDPAPAARLLDGAVRAMLRSRFALSMFPTPKLAYFAACAAAPRCKPHLRSIYRALFESDAAPCTPGGGHFTRFMLAGFAAFKAWGAMGVPALEAYPDLQFRLHARTALAPKRARRAALAVRLDVLRHLRRSVGVGWAAAPANLDQADAEVLALSAAVAARRGALTALEHPAEGRFLLTFNQPNR